MSIQHLIKTYIIDAIIVKSALENLLSVIQLQNEIGSINFVKPCTFRFLKRLVNISDFISFELYDITYRELYFLYLTKIRDEQLLKLISSKHSDDSNTKVTDFTTSLPTSSEFILLVPPVATLVLYDHIRSIDDMNSLRNTNTELYKHFTFRNMEVIAIENLRDIITKFLF